MTSNVIGMKPRATEEFLDYIFFRRVAARLIPFFVGIKMTPNQISFLSLGFGLLASVFLWQKLFFLSGLSAIVAMIVDCCDGQVARLTGQSSPMGRILDGVVDLIWIACFWVVLYKGTGYFQSHGMEIFPLMLFSSLSFILHTWRYDGVKVRSNELVYPDINKQDLDVPTAYELMQTSFRKGDYFNGILAAVNVFQAFFFVRGMARKPKYEINEFKREKLKEILEPVVNLFSHLGVTHHNMLIITATFLVPWTPQGYVVAFWIILVPMNLVWFYGEFCYLRAKKKVAAIL